MRDQTDRRRVQPRQPHPPTVGIPDEEVFALTTVSRVADAITQGRPVLADSDDRLFTVPTSGVRCGDRE